MNKKRDPILWIIILISISLHGWLLINAGTSFSVTPDTDSYQSSALSLLSTGKFSVSPQYPDSPETMRTPGYPFFLASIFAIFGVNYLSVLIIQSILISVVFYLIYNICLEKINQSTARLAILLLALDFAFFISAHFILTEALFTFMLTLSFYFGLKAFEGRRDEKKQSVQSLYFLSGLFFALTTLVRPVIYYLFPLLLVIFLLTFVFKKTSPSLTRTDVLVFILPCILLIGGWQVRNYLLTGNAQLSSIEGINLLYYRAAGSISQRDHISLQAAQEYVTHQIPDTQNLSTSEKSKIFTRAGIQIMLENPAATIKSQLVGLSKMMTDSGADDFLKQIQIVADSGPLIDLSQMPLNEYLEKWLNKPEYFIPFLFGIVYLALIYCTTLMLLFRLIKNRTTRSTIYLLCFLILIYFILISAGPEADARLRTPLTPFFSILAASEISALIKSRQEKEKIIIFQTNN